MNLSDIQEKAHQINVANGWWEEKRNDGEMIALMHSELSEALEYLRHGNPKSDHIPIYSGVAEEMADVVIRVMDFCEGRDIDLESVVLAKLDFNATRGYRHGGKTI